MSSTPAVAVQVLPEMKKPLFLLSMPLLAGVLGSISCGGVNAPPDPRVALVQSGELPADNLIIYDKGARISRGTKVLNTAGAFEMRGPTIVYVVRELARGDADGLQRDGLHVEEHTAYLLHAGAAALNLEALQKMRRIEPVDPAMTVAQIAVRFGFKESVQ